MRGLVIFTLGALVGCAGEITTPGTATDAAADGQPPLDRGPVVDSGPEIDAARDGAAPDQRVEPAPDRGPIADLGIEPDVAPPPDDPCQGAADGMYCGAELPGTDHRSAYVCANQQVAGVEPCPAGCEAGACVQPAADPCASAGGDGLYCGGTLTRGDLDTLYRCVAGATAEAQDCARGCRIAPPGTPDSCVREDDPCAAADAGDGAYCGSSLGQGDADALYICRGGQTVSASPCVDGCQQMPAGTPDACRMGGDPCAMANAGNGLYCGSSLGAGDRETLYDCAGGATVAARRCADGCQQMPPGTPDACRDPAPPAPEDPCTRADAGDGPYCGRTLGAGDPDTLYDCRGRVTRSAVRCPGGCQEMPPGTADACRPDGDPCAAANAGNGLYCGITLGAGDPNTLYDCQNRSTASAMPCPAGCQEMPPGTPDACRAVQDVCAAANAGDGAYCGRSLGAGDGDTLYECRGGAVTAARPCPDGCEQMPPGTPDACRAAPPAGGICDAAGAGDGAYCGSSLGAGDADTLYECRGGDVAGQTACGEGCRQNPPGVPDQCRRGDGECCLDRPPGALTQSFSACGRGGQHYGIDYGTANGTPIHAGLAGTVIASRLGLPNCYDNGCTPACWNAFNYVKLRADCGDPNDPERDLLIWYLHIEDLAPGIRDGARVEQGQLLAFSGNSGCSSGPHIHIETASVPRGGDTSLNTCASGDPASRYCP